MNRFSALWRRVFRGRQLDRDLDDEIDAYVELMSAEKMRNGMTPEEARRAVQREAGGVEQVRQNVRDIRIGVEAERLIQDLRFAARTLAKNPSFTLAAVFTLALGISASTVIFSVADAVLLRPLPYPDPGRLVRVWEQMPNGHRPNLAESNYEDFVAQNDTFASLAAFAVGQASVSGGSEPARIDICSVSGDFFRTLAVQPAVGRLFTEEELRPHGAPAIIVSHRYWQRYLGSSTDLGKFHLDMDGGSYPVVGVMPAGFDFPSFDFSSGTDAWISRELTPPGPSRTGHNWRVIGRLRDGVTVEHARADLGTIAKRIRHQYGTEVDLNDAAVVPLAEAIVGDVRAALLTLLGAVGLLLMVACANVAGLLVARTSARRKELAVRSALGAGRRRLIQQFLAESFVLTFTAGVAGMLLATVGVRLLPAILPANLPHRDRIGVNLAVLLFALAATALVAMVLGFFAAWRAASDADLRDALSSSARGQAGAASSQRLRSLLVVGEIATTLVILVGAGLLGRSFYRLISTSPGFRQENLATLDFSLPIPMDFKLDETAVAQQAHLVDEIVAQLRALPGTVSAGVAGGIPVAAGDNYPDGDFLILNARTPPRDYDEFGRMAQNHAITGHALYAVAGDEYFETLGIPLIRGRMFGAQDTANATHVALISKELARERWPDRDPIGQTLEYGNMDGNLKPVTVIGIVGDVRARGLDSGPAPIIYVDCRQRGLNVNSTPTILMRTTATQGQVSDAVRKIFHALAPEVPVRVSTFEAEMSGWLANRRFLLLLVALFAAVALVLAAVGLYGVVSFFVLRRTQEIGIRMAVGAQRSDVLRLVMNEGARLAAFGVVIGVAASLVVTRLMESLLYGVGSTDPLTFAAVAVVLAIVALAASYIPARRAIRVNPVAALRCE